MSNRRRSRQGITSPYVEVLYASKTRIKDIAEKLPKTITPRKQINAPRRNRESETKAKFNN